VRVSPGKRLVQVHSAQNEADESQRRLHAKSEDRWVKNNAIIFMCVLIRVQVQPFECYSAFRPLNWNAAGVPCVCGCARSQLTTFIIQVERISRRKWTEMQPGILRRARETQVLCTALCDEIDF
jgi:hypothetical protein